MDKFYNIWEPVKSEQNGNEIKTEVWGRSFTAGDKSFLQSIVSRGEELLSEPIRFVGTENGKEMVFGNVRNFLMQDGDGESSTVCSTVESDVFIINTSVKTEFDGCMQVGVSVMPQGRSVKQCFGLESTSNTERLLEKLYIEIPLNRETAKFYHFFPNSEYTLNGEKVEFDFIKQAGNIDGIIQAPFKEQIYISNDNVGLAMFFESDENFCPENEDKCVEIFDDGKSVVLRIRIFDSEPYIWRDKGEWSPLDLSPISFDFGIMATPIKPLDKNQYSEHAIHIDCFTKIAEDYEEFLFKPHGEDATVMDRFKRLGVNTLYLHEKWNDIQNSPFLTEKAANRLRLIVQQAHSRGIRVIPYFGYEISTLSPYFATMGSEVMQREEKGTGAWTWYRQPPQRDPIVCYKSRWQDVFVNGLEKLMDEYGFDGFYFDSTTRPMGCANEKHGCGYRDKDGVLHKTYTVWAVRQMMRRIYEIAEARGATINCHGATAFNIPAASFCHSMWEGEMMQQQLMNGVVDTIPQGHIRSVFTGRNIGVPVYMLCYSNPPVWTFKQALAQSIMYGIMPKPVDCEEPLELMSQVWRIFDMFDFENATWQPFYEGSEAVVSDANVKVSCYKLDFGGKTKRLVIAVNELKQSCKGVSISFPEGSYKISAGVNIADGDYCNEFAFAPEEYKIFITE